MRRLPKHLFVATLAMAATFLLAELAFRLGAFPVVAPTESLRDLRNLVVHGRIHGYEPRAHTVFAMRADERHNGWGFSGGEWELEAAPGVLRVACLGASTTQSGYPGNLRKLLEKRLERPVEVLNCGVSGWTTAETLVAWFLRVRAFLPDVVVIHHAANDFEPRILPGFRHDYSHYRRPFERPHYSLPLRLLVRWSDLATWLLLRSSPPTIASQTTTLGTGANPHEELAPATAYERNVETIGRSAADDGALVVLMTMPLRPPPASGPPGAVRMRHVVAEHNGILRTLAERHGWGLADAERFFDEHVDRLGEDFRDRVHLGGRGRTAKARLAAESIVALLGPSD